MENGSATESYLNSQINDSESSEISSDKAKPVDNIKEDDLQSIDQKVFLLIKENNDLLKKIKDDIDVKIAVDETKDKAFNKLYDELKEAKEKDNIKDSAIRPLLGDLLLFYDSLIKFKSKIETNNKNDEMLLKETDFILDELLEIFYRQNIEIIPENSDRTYDSKIQKAVKIEKNQEIDDNKIIKIIRSGFLWKDKMLRPQEVCVNKHN